ncbi:SpoIIE family protein phosphatase [Streptomyces sp. NPDC006743]|uniref:SpoIIE family protein phosphatase n=1 Tax=Streptomyces sp. NPDC006743 TaxID=3154480 RepID=UPI0034555915
MGVSGADRAFPRDPLDITSTAVAVVDAEGLIVRWSRGAQELLGRPAAEVLGRSAGGLFARGDAAAVVSGLRRVRRGWQGVVPLRHGDGHTVRLVVRVSPLTAPNGAPEWLVAGWDAVDLRRRELYATVARGLLEQSPFGVAVLDTGMRYRWVNAALAAMEEGPPARPGCRPAKAAPGPAPSTGAAPTETLPAHPVPTDPAPATTDPPDTAPVKAALPDPARPNPPPGRAAPAREDPPRASTSTPPADTVPDTAPAGPSSPGTTRTDPAQPDTAPTDPAPTDTARTGPAPPPTGPGDGHGAAPGVRLRPRAAKASPVVSRQARQALLSGRFRITLEPVPARPGAPGPPRPGRARLRAFFPLKDASGRTLGICYAALDLTGQDPSRRRLALLNAAGEHIGTTLDLDRTVRELTEVVVPQIADFVTVDLLDVVRARQMPAAWPERGAATLRRSAHRSVQEDEPDRVVGVGDPTRYPASSPQRRCLATGEPVRVAAVGLATSWVADDPARWHRLIRLGVHTHLVVPLRARGVTMGVVTLMRWKNPDPFDEDDVLLVTELVARAAVCVDNARRYAQEHRAALTLQTSLLPPALPAHSAVEVAHRYLPADAESGVGGDWYDVIPLSGARVALVVGDVVGHGLHAAASMGRLRAAVQTLADLDLAPDELLARLDDLVVRLSDEAEAADEGPAVIGATCVYAVYDPIARKIAVARAGHPSPAIAHLNEPVEFPDIPAGPPLGLGGLPFEYAEVPVEEGSVIALYTDGLIEASDRDVDVGMERLCFTLAHPDRPLEEICDVMVRTLLPDRPRDDVAFLIARTHVLSSDRVAYWEVPPDPAAVGVARGDVAGQLARWGLGEAAFSTELIVSELLTNAIRHACGPIGLRLIHERTLICEISDGASTSPHLKRARSTDEGGRGLFLVAQVAQRWGTRYSGCGKTIWAEQQLSRPGG